MYIKCTKAHSANTMLTTFHTRHKLYTLYNLNTRTKRISETLRNSCGNENNKEKHYYFIHCFNVQIFTSTKEKMASFFSFDFACYRTYAIEYSILISFWITLRSKLVISEYHWSYLISIHFQKVGKKSKRSFIPLWYAF